MHVKNKWSIGIACANIIACLGAGLPEYTNIGPVGYPFPECQTASITPSHDTHDVQAILNMYELEQGARNYDCSNKSEIIWYILNYHGFNATLAGNAGIYNGKISYHMFVWVHTDTGTVVVDPTIEYARVGTAIVPPDESLWTRGWTWNSPTDFIAIGNPDDMRGITMDTPIEELPIRRR